MLEETVTTDLVVKQDMTEKMPNYCPPRNPSHASFVLQAHPDHTVKWDPKGHPDQKEPLASHHAMAFPAILVWLDNQDLLAGQDEKAHEEHQEPLVVSSQFPDPKAHKDPPDLLESKGQRDNPVPMVNRSKAHPESPASQENPEKKADPDHPDPPVQPETMERKAVATIVQSHVPHQAIKQESTIEHSGFRKFGNGTTVSITLLFVSFLQLVENRKIVFDSMSLF